MKLTLCGPRPAGTDVNINIQLCAGGHIARWLAVLQPFGDVLSAIHVRCTVMKKRLMCCRQMYAPGVYIVYKKCDSELRIVGPNCCHCGLYVKVPVTMTNFSSNKAQRDEISHGRTAKAALSIVVRTPLLLAYFGECTRVRCRSLRVADDRTHNVAPPSHSQSRRRLSAVGSSSGCTIEPEALKRRSRSSLCTTALPWTSKLLVRTCTVPRTCI